MRHFSTFFFHFFRQEQWSRFLSDKLFRRINDSAYLFYQLPLSGLHCQSSCTPLISARQNANMSPITLFVVHFLLQTFFFSKPLKTSGLHVWTSHNGSYYYSSWFCLTGTLSKRNKNGLSEKSTGLCAIMFYDKKQLKQKVNFWDEFNQ